MADKPETEGGQPTLAAYWGKADGLEPVYVDNLHLQRINDQYYLTFGQLRAPMVMEPVEQVTVEIRAVARLIIGKDALRRMVGLLDSSLKAEEGA